MALTAVRAAVSGFSQLTIRAYAILGVDAPEQAIIRARDGRIWFSGDELAFPTKRRTQVWMFDVKTFGFADDAAHATPPAFRMARFTATRASCTL
jgi:hypothetical protein